MGIRDRDYMRRRPNDDEPRGYSQESAAERFARKSLRKYPRFFKFFAIGLGILIVVGLLIARFLGPPH